MKTLSISTLVLWELSIVASHFFPRALRIGKTSSGTITRPTKSLKVGDRNDGKKKKDCLRVRVVCSSGQHEWTYMVFSIYVS